jgi:hypothetical protein
MRNYLLGSCLALSLAATAPTFAQAQQEDTDAQRLDQRADRDDHSEWGWLGLLGLAGLMGLKRRDRTDDVRQGHAATR